MILNNKPNFMSDEEYLVALKAKAIQDSSEEVSKRLKTQFWIGIFILSTLGFLTVELYINKAVTSHIYPFSHELASKLGEVKNEVNNSKAVYKDIVDLESENKLALKNVKGIEESLSSQQVEVKTLVEQFNVDKRKYESEINQLTYKVKRLEVQINLLTSKPDEKINYDVTLASFNNNGNYKVFIIIYGSQKLDKAQNIYDALIVKGFNVQLPSYEQTGKSKITQVDIFYTSKGQEKLADIQSILDEVGGLSINSHIVTDKKNYDIAITFQDINSE